MPNVECHHHFFERRVSGPLSNAIDRDFHLSCPTHHSGEGVRGGHAQIVVAVATQHGFIDVGDVVADALDEVKILVGVREPGGVGHVNRGRAGLDDFFHDFVHVVEVGSAGIFHEVLDVVGELSRVFHGTHPNLKRLLFRHAQLVLKVIFAHAKPGVNPATFSRFQGFRRHLNVFLASTGESANGHSLDLSGEGLYRLKIARRTNGESSFDNVHAEVSKGVGNGQFLLHAQSHAWALFAISERRIEDQNLVLLVHAVLWPLGAMNPARLLYFSLPQGRKVRSSSTLDSFVALNSDLYALPDGWEEPEGFAELLSYIREHNPTANLSRLRYAFFVAEEGHRGQTRQSGEPYITHPLAVATIVAELRMDEDSICAALLHDVLEDTTVSRESIEESFGAGILHLVDGVTKLKFRQQEALTERQRQAAKSAAAAETLRKMLLAMAEDVRVMVIKLADRLHNMRTLDAMAADKRLRIASETLDIYAPLAARLGIWQIKWQLEDLSFKYLHPKEFQEITELVNKKREVREEELREAVVILKDRLHGRGLKNIEINGRPKHLYSIFNKIVKHGFKFEEILDLLAMRVVVEEISDCYLALGIVHEAWVPIPAYFADYIAKPKPNGYQSLHTKVLGPHGDPLEVQIRTHEMHQVAEYGVAAHWAYKESGDAAGQKEGKFTALRSQLFDWSTDHRMSSDFLRSLTTDLFSEQVFAFTPKGDVLDLPQGSTPIDFAFRVHTNLGTTLVGAKINGQIVPLGTELKNGDVVELITRSNAQPSLDWMEHVKSAHARSKLRTYFRKRNREENILRGREALEREVRSQSMDPKDVMGEERLLKVVPEFKDCETVADLFAKIGEGLQSPLSVANRLRGLLPKQTGPEILNASSRTREQSVMKLSGGVDNVMYKRGKCCDPLPGEDVVGYVTRGRGIIIHRQLCSNVVALEQAGDDRFLPIQWDPEEGAYFTANLRIISMNRQGLLMDITTIFGESKTNVVQASIKTLPNQTAVIDVTVDVGNIAHLNLLTTKIGNFSDVISVLRTFGKKR